MDAKYNAGCDGKTLITKWDLYRSAMGHWVVNVLGEQICSDRLVTVLRKALSHKHLPVIPRAPVVYDPWDLGVVKSGNSWTIQHRGEGCYWNFKTKTEAVKGIATILRVQQADRDRWEGEYGAIVANGAEGVDFRYEGTVT